MSAYEVALLSLMASAAALVSAAISHYTGLRIQARLAEFKTEMFRELEIRYLPREVYALNVKHSEAQHETFQLMIGKLHDSLNTTLAEHRGLLQRISRLEDGE